MKRKSIQLIVMLAVVSLLAPAAFGQGRGRGKNKGGGAVIYGNGGPGNRKNLDKKCAKFVNCHDARDGRWDGRGPRVNGGAVNNGIYIPIPTTIRIPGTRSRRVILTR